MRKNFLASAIIGLCPGRSTARSSCGTVRCRAGAPVTCCSKKPGSRFCEAALREELRAASRPGHEIIKRKTGPKAPLKSRNEPQDLFDLGLLELDVLARDRIVL